MRKKFTLGDYSPEIAKIHARKALDMKKGLTLGDYRPVASEHSEQATFFDWLLKDVVRVYPEVHPLFFAVPNGAHLAGGASQRARAMNILKAEGFTPGVADTLFLSGRGGYLGLALEFKRRDQKGKADGGVSDNQREFLQAAKMEGFQTAVAYGADEAISIALDYFATPKTQALIYRALAAAEKGDLEGCREILRDIALVW